MTLIMDKIILASASPRRQQLLSQMGLPFDVRPQHIDETFTGLPPADEAMLIAKRKAEARLDEAPSDRDRWVLAADTFVVLGGDYLGKPADRSDAGKMLRMLAGNTHQVVTGLALNAPGRGIITECCVTDVVFCSMSDSEVEWYLDQNEWEGVAASYRIQEKAACFISSVSGSYSNVMGLPINTFYGMLRAENFNFRN